MFVVNQMGRWLLLDEVVQITFAPQCHMWDSFKFPLVAVSTIDIPRLCFVVKSYERMEEMVCLLLLVSMSNKLWYYACSYKNNLFKTQESLIDQANPHTHLRDEFFTICNCLDYKVVYTCFEIIIILKGFYGCG